MAGGGRSALKIVQEFFPDVKSVKDATKPLTIEVNKRDVTNAAKRDHKACAMAVACKRAEGLDGIIVSVATAYTIKDGKATRYMLPESVSREVVSFDRGGGFAPGSYRMDAPPESRKMGARTGGEAFVRPKRSKGQIRRTHQTEGIRTILGSHGH